MAAQGPVHVEFMGSHAYNTALPAVEDPFRHKALANSHNHHDLHPWGSGVVPGTKEFDALYAEANNRYMYHLWYTPELAPHMATDILKIVPLSDDLFSCLVLVLQSLLESGLDAALQTPDAHRLLAELQRILDDAVGSPTEDKIFVRLSATSTKDSFALNVPTTKPDPLEPDAEAVLRRLLTSRRTVGRLLSLSEKVWPSDPGEAIIVQRWSPDIELAREIRAFSFDGRITAVSQDVWWEKLGWRQRYSEGMVKAIVDVWESVKSLVPFDTCTMDVFVTPPADEHGPWKAQIIEFNGFGAHLNTGSDLFHWVNDSDILHGKRAGVTVRLVDDWEKDIKDDDDKKDEVTDDVATRQSDGKVPAEEPTASETGQGAGQDADEPDWLVLEKKLRLTYAQSAKGEQRLEMEKRTKLPLRGRWCSAY